MSKCPQFVKAHIGGNFNTYSVVSKENNIICWIIPEKVKGLFNVNGLTIWSDKITEN